MRCSQVHKHSSAYLDGDLDAERSSALRGHLRVCVECAQRLADEQSVLRAAAGLEPLDPPPRVWEQIATRLAAEEVADSRRASALLRLRGLLLVARPYRAHLAVGLTLAAVVAALVARRTYEQPIAIESSLSSIVFNAVTITNIGSAVFAPDVAGGESHLEAALREIHEADDRYLTAIGSLRTLAEAERPTWSEGQRTRFDGAVKVFEERSAEILDETGRETTDSRRRDPLYQLYRQHIAFLEDLVFGRLSLRVEAGQ